MTKLLASGRLLIDVVLGLMLLEAASLIAYHIMTGRGVAPVDLLINLLAGCCLLLGARSALVGGWWGWTAASLVAALVAHVADLHQRWIS